MHTLATTHPRIGIPDTASGKKKTGGGGYRKLMKFTRGSSSFDPDSGCCFSSNNFTDIHDIQRLSCLEVSGG